jgi:DNA-binding LacI/PurR family transcriptional regulator
MAKYKQISSVLRQRLLQGELKPGTVLPTTKELANEFETNVYTMQSAIEPLVKDGFLERRRKFGTVVKHNPAVLTTAAIYSNGDTLGSNGDAFRWELSQQLQLQLNARNVQVETFVDSRPKDQRGKPFPALLRAVENNEVQALLALRCDQNDLAWLQDLPIASSLGTNAPIPNRVYSNTEQMLRLGLQNLRDQGCRTVGLICNIQNSAHLSPESSQRQFYRNFIDILGEVGLITRDAWMAVPDFWQPAIEWYGYNQFNAIWKQAEHPDGLMVFPDVAARGVMTAALELGVRVPDELQLVFHRNSGVDMACSLPITWVESDTAAWAAAMIDQVCRQKAGKPVTKTLIEYKIVEKKDQQWV